jgi:membrane protease YdiL (CAAX protease family)
MSQDSSDATSHAAAPPPWGFWSSIAWGALGIAVWLVVQFIALLAYIATRDASLPLTAEALRNDGFLLGLLTVASAPGWIAVAVIAARRRGWSARDYLALVPPRRGEIAFGVACFVALLVALDLLSLALGRDVVPRFMVEAYTSARNSGTLVLLVVAVVVAAPITEEIAFRGFLFRGLAASFVGVPGALVLTSAAWTVMHIQYDFFLLAHILLIGLLLGWLRWASGSTVLTIGLHALANLVATVQAAIKVEWMG